MCGIAGAWGDSDVETVRSMLDRLAHRGPDAAAIVDLAGGGTLGHRRLAIIDPDGGDQPIANEDRSKRIITNGEIYNFRQLRSDLESRHVFQTESDGESVLHLFEELGPSMVRKLDGMFAIAVVHGKNLFLARDPLGVKPLYYTVDDTDDSAPVLFFASEIKALTDLELKVRAVPPGTCYDFERGFLPYYRVPEYQPRERPDEVLRSILRETLERAIEKRLMSDVPVGVFLSGGLDSSIVAAIAARHLQPLHTFAVGTEGSSDLEAARVVARYIGSEHHEYVLDPEEIGRDLGTILYHLESFDQDLVRSAIPCFYCSRLASEHVKVVLTGEGADELFAGYDYYRQITDAQLLQAELRRSVAALHNVNLQRVDRMTMAHGVEGRVPFLDLDMVHLAQGIPPKLKLHRRSDGTVVDKWILRTVVEDLLPQEIVWREKLQFDQGSGTLDTLETTLRHQEVRSFKRDGAAPSLSPMLRSREESIYYRLIVESFGEAAQNVIDNAGCWGEGRVGS
ncbi:MAG: asparagine synthase B [Acidobacteriota bacterium]